MKKLIIISLLISCSASAAWNLFKGEKSQWISIGVGCAVQLFDHQSTVFIVDHNLGVETNRAFITDGTLDKRKLTWGKGLQCALPAVGPFVVRAIKDPQRKDMIRAVMIGTTYTIAGTTAILAGRANGSILADYYIAKLNAAAKAQAK